MATCSSADSVLNAATQIKSNATKLNDFVNGTATQTVQLGASTDTPTPTLRKFVADAQSTVALAANDAAQTVLDTVAANETAVASLENDKADKVNGNVEDHIAALDMYGNLQDGGINMDDVAIKSVDIANLDTDKANKVSGATAGDIAVLNASGDLVDSGVKPGDKADIAALAECVRAFSTRVTAENCAELGISDINDLTDNRIYLFPFVISGVDNQPPVADNLGFLLISFTSTVASAALGGQAQIAIGSDGRVFSRMLWGSPAAWTDWSEHLTADEKKYFLKSEGTIWSAARAEALGIDDINTIAPNTIYAFTTLLPDILNQPFSDSLYTLITMAVSDAVTGGTVQFAFSEHGIAKCRVCWGNPAVWHRWETFAGDDGRIVDVNALTPQAIFSHWSTDGYINYATGEHTDYLSSGVYSATAYIPIMYGSVVTVEKCCDNSIANNAGLAFYDSQKKYISGIQYGAKTSPWGFMPEISAYAPDGACFMRLTVKNTCAEACHFNAASPATSSLVGQMAFRTAADAPSLRCVPNSLLECFLTVGCIGDSLSSGESMGSSLVDIYPHSWGQYLARMTGNTYYNWSAGGLRTDTWLSSQYAAECYDGNHLCTAYIIGLGVNDYNYMISQGLNPAAFIGTSSDINAANYNLNANTFCGRYGKIIQKIQEIQPKAKIFVCTSLRDAQETSGINDAIRAVSAKLSNTYLMDLKTYCDGVYNTGLISQMLRSGHYNAVGYHEMALMMSSYIDWIIRANPSEFSQIEFIGTDYSYGG